jgi:hypothetical protein
VLTSKNSNLVDRLGFEIIHFVLVNIWYKSTWKKSLLMVAFFGEAFAIVVESLKHESRLGSYDLIWPWWVICLRLTSVVKIVWTSRCSIYEIPCTKLGFNSILVIILRFASSHWLIYYPFGISLVTSLVQKMGCGLGWLSLVSFVGIIFVKTTKSLHRLRILNLFM